MMHFQPFHTPPPVPLRVLVVENDDDTRTFMRLLLQALGHRVNAVGTMRAALEELLTADYDVLVSDIGLPDGSGWELMQRVRPRAPPYAVAVSGMALDDVGERSRAVGFRHHLVKPYGVEQLPALLNEAARERPVPVPAPPRWAAP